MIRFSLTVTLDSKVAIVQHCCLFVLKLLGHIDCVAYRESTLFCHSVTYMGYTTACRVICTIPVANIDNIM